MGAILFHVQYICWLCICGIKESLSSGIPLEISTGDLGHVSLLLMLLYYLPWKMVVLLWIEEICTLRRRKIILPKVPDCSYSTTLPFLIVFWHLRACFQNCNSTLLCSQSESHSHHLIDVHLVFTCNAGLSFCDCGDTYWSHFFILWTCSITRWASVTKECAPENLEEAATDSLAIWLFSPESQFQKTKYLMKVKIQNVVI